MPCHLRLKPMATEFALILRLKGLPTESLRCRSRTLDDHRDRIAAAKAQGRETALGAAVLHRVSKRREDAGAAAADRMPEGHRSTVHVELLVGNSELAHHGDARGGIRLVVFEQIDVVDREARLLQEFPDA